MRKAKQRSSLKQKPQKNMLKEYRYTIYTDGSSNLSSKEQYGGSAYIIIDNKENKVISEWSNGYRYTSNNKMEIHAINEAIESLPNCCSICLISDSKYAIGVLSHTNRNYEKNTEYIEHFRGLIKRKGIACRFQWVKSHSKVFYNEKADLMAKSAMREVQLRFESNNNV